MLYKHQLLKSFALLLLLKMCLLLSVQATTYDYYIDMDGDEALSAHYGNQIEEHTTLPPSTEVPPLKTESESAPEGSQDTSQPRQETNEQEQDVTDQTPKELSAVGSDEDLRQLAAQNTNAVKKIAAIMAEVVSKLSNQGCVGTRGDGVNHNMEMLSSAIKEGFTVMVGAVQDLNATLKSYQEEITRKAFGTQQAATTFENDGPCPEPFFLVGSDCLYIETEHLRDFQTARQACIDMGAKLAEFKDYQPFVDAVNGMDLRHSAEILIGGTDEAFENHWVWLSGDTMPQPIPWGPGEPNNIDQREDCIALKPRLGKFNDLKCSIRKEYACQWMPFT